MVPAGAPAPARPRRPGGVQLLTAATALAAAGLATASHGHLAAPPSPVAWWWLLPAFLVGEALVVHLPMARGASTLTFREVPAALALLAATADGYLAAALTASVLWLVLRVRQRGTKLAFNVAGTALESCVALLVFHGVLALTGASTGAAAGPGAWVSALVAVLVADALVSSLVTAAIALDGGGLDAGLVREALTSGALVATANASLAVLVWVLLQRAPTALGALAVVVGVVLASMRSRTALAARAGRAEALQRFVGSLGAAVDLRHTAEELLAGARGVLLAEAASLVLVGARGEVVRRATLDDAGAVWLDGASAAAGLQERPWWLAARSGRSTLVAPGPDAPPGGVLAVRLDGAGAAAGATGSLLGEVDLGRCVLVLQGRHFAERPFRHEDLPLAEAVAGHALAALSACALVEQREHDARHDALTGLLSAHGLGPHLEDLLAPGGGGGAVVHLDLDGSGDIGETLGAAAADEVLRQVAGRLAASGHPVARLAGDGYAVVLARAGRERAVAEAHALRDRLSAEPVALSGAGVLVTATAGVALAPEHGTTPEALLTAAGTAVRAARRGGEPVAVHTPADEGGVRRRLLLAAQLGAALEDGGGVLPLFQPKVDRAGRLVGAEALVRWDHPEHGLLGPLDVVPLAERTGAQRRLTAAVLTRSLRARASWARSGLDVPVAVNTTMQDLRDPGFPGAVTRLLAATGTAPDRLTLEITEGSVMADPEGSLRVLRELASRGVRLSVDDFGTGHSSLAYLDRLPVHEVKVDRSFVVRLAAAPAHDAVVRATVELAHALGMSVVAEGVEDLPVAHLLWDLGVDVLQGYWFGRPQRSEALLAGWPGGVSSAAGGTAALSASPVSPPAARAPGA